MQMAMLAGRRLPYAYYDACCMTRFRRCRRLPKGDCPGMAFASLARRGLFPLGRADGYEAFQLQPHSTPFLIIPVLHIT